MVCYFQNEAGGLTPDFFFVATSIATPTRPAIRIRLNLQPNNSTSTFFSFFEYYLVRLSTIVCHDRENIRCAERETLGNTACIK